MEIGTFVYKLTAAVSPLSVLKLASAVSDTQCHSTGVDCSVWPMCFLMTITVLLLHDVVTLCHCLYTRAANDVNEEVYLGTTCMYWGLSTHNVQSCDLLP